ncbi:MAG: hypothetical protein KIT40_13585 [Nitrospira sp.]|nr:hypothetical protein [Nitrospira sp.]
MKKSIIHGIAGAGALLTITTFWTSTLISELFLSHEAVLAVKQAIVKYGLVILVLFMASVGASGFSLGKGRKGPLIEGKKKRMPIIALNGLLIMVPSALFLNFKATNGEFDKWFYLVQVLELSVGAVQFLLLGLSFRDGLKLTGKLRPQKKVAPST